MLQKAYSFPKQLLYQRIKLYLNSTRKLSIAGVYYQCPGNRPIIRPVGNDASCSPCSQKLLEIFVFVSHKIVTSNEKVFHWAPKFKWSERTGSYSRHLSDAIMSPYTQLLDRKIFWKEFEVLMKQKFCTWNTFSTRIVLMKHNFCAWHTLLAIVWCSWNILCLAQPFSTSYVVHETSILCLTHTFRKYFFSYSKMWAEGP